MRKIININKNWYFTKENKKTPTTIHSNYEKVNVPHTWNGIDGQDGGNDYYRNKCFYVKKLSYKKSFVNKQVYIEFNGTNSSSVLYVNKKLVASHDGGYSTYRANITSYLKKNNIITLMVDNSKNDNIYPQLADFTFYGGIYRDVNLIVVDNDHFDLDYYGGKGVSIIPTIVDNDAILDIHSYVVGNKNKVKVSIIDKDNNVILTNSKDAIYDNSFNMIIKNVHLWDGTNDPYLYKARFELFKDNKKIDKLEINFGCRSYKIDPTNGFILNGKEYPLRGVCRHQDRPQIGNALLPIHHEEDMELIREVGANVIRLAHYQHDQYFYDLCDKYGIVVWAEIPYISDQLANGKENTLSQMKELIIQNINHPSIVVWGLSNEITMNNPSNEKIVDNHKDLNDLCHKLDPSRLTTMAIIGNCPIDDPYIKIPDVVAFNLYLGWYGGNATMNGEWLDNYHNKYPSIPVGLSEYGCEALNWHSSNPVRGDYSEEYQAYYHETLIKQLFTRKYIWTTNVWNMFDFGADRRHEGGEDGINHKGLVSFDRKYKKDSFYAYKAWLSKEPFIHICSKKYIDRVEDIVTITIYSNLEEIELFANGISQGIKKADDHFFKYQIKNDKEVKLVAISNNYKDEAIIRKVDKPNPEYILNSNQKLKNWFEN